MADGLLFHCSLEVLAYPNLVWAELLLFFHHKPSVTRITDFQPALRNNEDLIGQGPSVPVSRDGPRSRQKAISSAL